MAALPILPNMIAPLSDISYLRFRFLRFLRVTFLSLFALLRSINEPNIGLRLANGITPFLFCDRLIFLL
ncbi:MAG: hypothetical protein DRI81_18065 [Chloroflexi bacterium]|nr:MAG: hypothetical protein DRI81_18065 [Chloroflexota bacterium]